MARPRSQNNITCQNQKCKFYSIEEGKDIVKHGKNKAGHQRYFCNHCHTWFVETTNTFLYRKHLSKSDVVTIFKLVNKEKSIRRIEQISGHHRDTIRNLLYDFTRYPEKMDEFLINEAGFKDNDIEIFWCFIIKHSKELSFEIRSYLDEYDSNYPYI